MKMIEDMLRFSLRSPDSPEREWRGKEKWNCELFCLTRSSLTTEGHITNILEDFVSHTHHRECSAIEQFEAEFLFPKPSINCKMFLWSNGKTFQKIKPRI